MAAHSVQGTDIKWGASGQTATLNDLIQATNINITLPQGQFRPSTHLNSTSEEFIPVIKGSWSIDFDLELDTSNAQHDALLTELVAASFTRKTWRVTGVTNLGTFTGEGWAAGASLEAQVMELGKIKVKVTGTGDLTYAA